MNSEDVRIAVVGPGYGRLPLAVEVGKQIEVLGCDTKSSEAELRADEANTLEVSSEELSESEGLRFNDDPDDLAWANVYIVTAPTPIDQHKRPDRLLSASRAIAGVLKRGDVVTCKSTLYPGATEDCVPDMKELSGLRSYEDFFVGHSAERINPGDKEHHVSTIMKVTSGSTPESAEFVDEPCRRIVTAGRQKAQPLRVAEAIDVIESTQRNVNIALISELAILFNKLGIDTKDLLKRAGTKRNLLPYRPGLVGGHYAEVAPNYLTYKAQAVGHHLEIIHVGRRLNGSREAVRGARVIILALRLGENTPDLRSTRVYIVTDLTGYGIVVDLYDQWGNGAEAMVQYGLDLSPSLEPGAYDGIVFAVAHRAAVKMTDGEVRPPERCIIDDPKQLPPPEPIGYAVVEMQIRDLTSSDKASVRVPNCDHIMSGMRPVNRLQPCPSKICGEIEKLKLASLRRNNTETGRLDCGDRHLGSSFTCESNGTAARNRIHTAFVCEGIF